MKIFLFVSKTPLLILIWLNSITAQGYNYYSPQPYNEKYYRIIVSDAQQVQNIPQQYATLPAGTHVNVPPLQQQQHFQQLPQNPGTHSSAFNAARNLFAPQTNNVLHPANLNTNFMNANNNNNAKPGDYVSQSEASQLDQYPYPYKQKQVGDNRAFTRYVTSCSQGGICANSKLGPGTTDPIQQQILQKLRASVQYDSKACSKDFGNHKSNMPSQPNSYTYGPPLPPQQYHQHPQQHYQHQVHPQIPLQQQQQQPVVFARNNNFVDMQPQLQTSPLRAYSQTQLPNRPPERRLYPYTEVIRPSIYN